MYSIGCAQGLFDELKLNLKRMRHSKKTNAYLNAEKIKSEKTLQLLNSLMSISPLENENEKIENYQKSFDTKLVTPLNDYAFFAINLTKISLKKSSELEKVIEDIAFDETEFVSLLQNFYKHSIDVISNNVFKTYWLFVDIKQKWDLYPLKKSVENFKNLTTKILSPSGDTIKLQDKNQYENWKSTKYNDILNNLNKVRSKLISDNSSMNEKKYGWLTIKHLSMSSFMKHDFFENLSTTEVTYNGKAILLKDAYNTILSTMDTYALVKSYFISVSKLLEPFNKWLVNISLTYSEIYKYPFDTDERLYFEMVQNFLSLAITTFMNLFRKYFSLNLDNICSKSSINIYKFVKSQSNTTNNIESLRKIHLNNFLSDDKHSLDDYAAKDKKDQEEMHEVWHQNFSANTREEFLTSIYQRLAEYMFNEPYIINCVLDELTECDEDNKTDLDDENIVTVKTDIKMYEVNMRRVFSRTMRQMNKFRLDKDTQIRYIMLQNNLTLMTLVISEYTCAIVRRLKIKSEYIIYTDAALEEKEEPKEYNNIDYDENEKRKYKMLIILTVLTTLYK